MFSSLLLMTTIAPSWILRSLLGTTRSSSILYFIPSPLHSGQAPQGALNENILGSRVGREKSHSGQAYVSLSSFLSPPTTSMITFPLPSLVAVSILSYSLLLISGLITNLSTTTSFVCFLFLSKVMSSDKSCSSPSIRTLT